MRIVHHSPAARRHSWQALQRSLADDVPPASGLRTAGTDAHPATSTSWLARARSRAQSVVAAFSAQLR